MKKQILLFATSLFLASCQLTERVFIKQDGSIKYAFSVESSQLAAYISTDPKIDSLRKIGEFPIDTILPLSEMEELGLPNLPKSSKNKEAKASKKYQELAKQAKFHLVLNENKMNFTIFFKKESVAALNAYTNALQDAKEERKLYGNNTKESKENTPFYSNVRFSYDGKTFTRHSKITDKKNLAKKDSLPSVFPELFEFSEMMTINLEYHFPKPIKTCSIEEATFSNDRKTLYVEAGLIEVNKNSEKYNFTVTF